MLTPTEVRRITRRTRRERRAWLAERGFAGEIRWAEIPRWIRLEYIRWQAGQS
jgi:hypothetical protein